MHRQTLPLLALLLLAVGGAAQKPDAPKKPAGPLADARQRLLRGNYDEARDAFAAAAKADPKLAPQAAIGTAESYRLVGEYEKALDVLNAALTDSPTDPDLLAERGHHLFHLGKWDAAEKDADAAIAAKPDQLLARWTKAKILRDRGSVKEADDAFRWVVRYYTKRSNDDNEITDPQELLWVAECGAENARWHSLSKQFSFILNTVLKDALKADPDFWPAEQLAGSLLLEKYNRPDALDAFDAALKVNPKSADALAGKAQAALVKFDLKDADAFADQALKHNPRHPAALRVKADIQIHAGDFPAADKELRKAYEVNPRDSVTLGKLAAVQYLQGKVTAYERIAAEVDTFDSKPGQFGFEVGAVLEERKQYAMAERFYKKAAEVRPHLAGPRTGLGMLYLRLGNEAEGRKLLAEAFEKDKFNVRVSNSLKVLDHLDKYVTVETPHYLLRYDAKTDGLLAEWLADYLEEVHAELHRQFGFEPPGKVLIEVFNSHEMFSGRTVGLPDLHTIGACTGRVVAMASPKAKGLAKPFNWGRVMRHELTHIFNLAQTDFQCPHWLTEGLAVQNENMKRSPQWTQILRDRYDSDTLLTLDTILLGFVRPKGPEEWTLAYAQSQLYVEYLVQAHGQEAVGKLLDEFKASKDTAAALKAACNVDKATFEKGYKAHVAATLRKAKGGAKADKKPAEKPMTFDELTAAVEKDPDDPDLSARLADAHLRRNNVSDARKLADAVLAKQPAHPTAAVVKAKLLSRAGDEDAAKAVLAAALKAKPDDPKLLVAVGRVHLEKKEFAEAAKLFEKGREVAPDHADWTEQLVRIYKELKDNDKLLPLLAELVSHDPDELDGRVRLARMSLEAGKFAEAEAFARDALMIDVANTDAKDTYLTALRKQKKDELADKIEKRYEK
jgi:predicted Zn-dependent protease